MDQNWKGLSVDETVKELRRRYHPEESAADVKRAYFPSRGIYAITRLEGKPHGTLLEKLQKFRANAERMRQLNQDPEFARARGERMRQLNQDPEFARSHAERASERMRRLHRDPEFEKLIKAGIKAYWERKRQEKSEDSK